MYRIFDANTFAPESDVVINCKSNVTLTSKGVTEQQIHSSFAFTRMLPPPQGTFLLVASGNNSIQLSLQDYSPYLGLSEEEFQEEKDFNVLDENDYIIPSQYSELQYLPYLFTLYANYQSQLIEVWSQLSLRSFKNFNTKIYLDQFYDKTLLTFTLIVSNDWVTSYQDSPLSVTIQDSDNTQFELAILQSNGSTQDQVKKCLLSLMIYSSNLNKPKGNICICQNQGHCENGICRCKQDFVGTQCEHDRATTLTNICNIYSAFHKMLINLRESLKIDNREDRNQSEDTIYSISFITTQLSGINSLADQILVNGQISILESLYNFQNSNLLSIRSATNMIRICSHTENQIDVFQKGSISNLQSSTLVEEFFQKILVLNHKIMIKQDSFYQHIVQDKLNIVLTVLNLTSNDSQSINFNGFQFAVDKQAILSELDFQTQDYPAIFIIKRQLKPLQKKQVSRLYFIQNSSYIQVNISKPETYQPMFKNTTSETYKQNTISLTYPYSIQGGRCLCFDKITNTWTTSLMTTLVSSTFTKCSTYHLNDFAIGLLYQGEDKDQNQDYQDNQIVGKINLIIVLVVYLIISFSISVIHRIKGAQVHDIPGKNKQYYVPQNDPSNQQQFTPSDEQLGGIYNLPSLGKSSSGEGAENRDESPYQVVSTKTKDDELKLRRLYNFVLCLCPYPQTWIPSQHRLSIIFLWFTCYQALFAIINSTKSQDSNFFGVLFQTLLISNIFNYIYAGLALGLSECVRSKKYIIVQCLINFIILVQLIIVYLVYTNSDLIQIGQDHINSSIFQITINLGLFDFLMELISKYPGIGVLRRLRSFNLMDFLDI